MNPFYYHYYYSKSGNEMLAKHMKYNTYIPPKYTSIQYKNKNINEINQKDLEKKKRIQYYKKNEKIMKMIFFFSCICFFLSFYHFISHLL